MRTLRLSCTSVLLMACSVAGGEGRYEPWDKENFGQARFVTIKPGEVKRAHFPDLRPHLEGELAGHGAYRLKYLYFGARRLAGAPAKEELARSWKGTLESNTAAVTRRPLTK